MTLSAKLLIIGAATAAGAICPLCKEDAEARPQRAIVASERADTATVRLHISKMTCATCTVTARVALKKLAGVYDATVSYGDSLGVVSYDPQRVTPTQIAEHLTRLTGYPANILPDSVAKPDSSRS
jgi:copper chaperone CopZ